MKAVHLDEARLYDEQFAKVLPSDWEMAILSKHLSSAKTLLDVGCGTGRHTVLLAERGLRVLAIDKNKDLLKAAEEKLRHKRLTGVVDLLMVDARHIPLSGVSFGAVICMGNVLGEVGVRKHHRTAIIEEMINMAGSETVFIIELVHRYWKPSDLFVWLFRYLATGMRKLVGRSSEYGDYTETIKLDHHADKLTFHAFTAREARRLLADRGLQTRVEKRAKFFYDWFIVVATRKDKHKEAS